MSPALRLLLDPARFVVSQLYRMGQIGWHWQFDDPNLLYRRRNRLTYTRDFGNAAWTKTASTITADATTAPDGTTTADLLLDTAATSVHRVTQAASIPSGASATISLRFKQHTAGYNCQILMLSGANYISNIVSSADGSVLTVDDSVGSVFTNRSVAVTGPDAQGFYTVALSASTAGVTTLSLLAGVTNGTTAQYLGDGTKGLYLWGAQLEATSSATEYQDVPTTWAQAYLDAVGAQNIYAWTDTAGTTPVTAIGEGIGLLLGREYGGVRGVERVTNGGFDSDLTGWTNGLGSIAWVSGAMEVTRPSAGVTTSGYQAITTVVGKTYEVTGMQRIVSVGAAPNIVARTGTDPNSSPSVGFGSAGVSTSMTPNRFVFTATGTTTYLHCTAGTGAGVVAFDSISIREIPGTHLTQATGTAKPTLSARVNLLLSTTTMSTQNVTTVATSYKLSFTGTGTVTLSGTSTAGPLVGTGANDRVSLTFTPTAGTLTLTVSGSVTLADLRTADDAAKNIPAYQRVGATASDHDTDGFPHGVYPDGTDDSGTTATGGGNTTGFFYCGALTVSGGAGAARTIWSDTGTNTGYRVRINASNKLELAAGNGSAYTTVQSNETITAPGTYLLSAWDDGGVLAVQVNNFAPATTTRPTVSAGTAAITAYKDNGAASSYFNGRDYGSVYAQRYIGDTAHNRLKRYLANVARITV